MPPVTLPKAAPGGREVLIEGLPLLTWSPEKRDVLFFFFFFKYFYCVSSDFSDLPDMTDEYIDLSVYALTGWLLYYCI